MAATFKQTTILFVVLAFLRSYTASAQEGSRRDNQPVRNDQEKPSERLDQVERRNQPPKTIREMIAWELAHNSETDRKPEDEKLSLTREKRQSLVLFGGIGKTPIGLLRTTVFPTARWTIRPELEETTNRADVSPMGEPAPQVYTGRDGLRVFGRDENPVRHSERLREQPTVAPRTAAPTPPKPPDYQFLDTDGESETSILLRKIQKTLDEERLYREIRLKSYQLQEEENVRTQTNKDAKEAQERQQKLKQKMQQPNRRPFRWKREVKIHPQLKPEVVMQPRMEMPMEKETEEKYQEKLSKTREKRQVLYLIGGRTPQLLRPPRTTPNPFIRQTNIEDYEIVRPRLGDEFRQAPGNDADAESSVEDSSYQLSETSDIEYDSEYSISMSDSEDWENFPLTTPSGPNPGWGLSTLADIYQRPHRTGVRAKRSPKEKRRKIGKYREKLEERRKRKDMKRKRRIIRNSKEDKEVKEDVKVEEAVENLLKKQVTRKRVAVYQLEDTSKEVLWYNKTHRVVADPGATFKWLNKTHFAVFKENATDRWFNEHHVLVYHEDFLANQTREKEKGKKKSKKDSEDDEEYDEDYYDEDFTEEEAEERADIEKRKKEMREKERKLTKKMGKVEAPMVEEEREPEKKEVKIEKIDVEKEDQKKEKGGKKKKVKFIKEGSEEEDKKDVDEEIDVGDKKLRKTDKEKKILKKKVKKVKSADKVKAKEKSDEEVKTRKVKKVDGERIKEKKGVKKKLQSEEQEPKVSSKKENEKIIKKKKTEPVREGGIRKKKKSYDKKLKNMLAATSGKESKESEDDSEQKPKRRLKKKTKNIDIKENRPQKTKVFKKTKSNKDTGKKTKKE